MKVQIQSQTAKARKALLGTLAAAAVLTTVACGSQHGAADNDKNVINTASIAGDVKLTPEAKAEKLARAAEQLLSPSGFTYADTVADQALSFDPKNVRARFWKAALGPAMAMRGIANRVAPIAKSRPKWNAEYERSISEMKMRVPEKAAVEFLLDGPQDIQSEKDLQDVIANVTLKMDEFRRTIKEIKNEEFSITINSEAMKKNALNEASQSCQVTEIREGVYSLENCDVSEAFEVRLNRADLEALQHVIAGYQIYLTAANSWDLTGAIEVAAKVEKDQETDALNELLKNPSFGRLREGATLGVVPEAAKDFAIGVRYAMSMQRELCPKGPASKNRPGYLFSGGLCVPATKTVESQLRALELMISGNPTIVNVNVNHQTLPVVVDANSFVKAPISDVRQLLPIQKDACGHVTGLGDGKAGGAFPYGDLNTLLSERAKADGCWEN